MPKLPLLIFVLCFPFILTAQSNEALFRSANEAYTSKDFGSAIEKYEKILKSGERSAALYYNLGNAYYKQNSLGKAILNYERGLALDRRDADIRYNLELARKNLEDKIETLPPFFLSRWWSGIRALMSAKGWAIVALAVFWLGLAGLIVWQLANIRRYKKIGFVFGLALLLLGLFPFALSIDSSKLEKDSQRAVILSEEEDLKSGPDQTSTSILLLHQGTTVELLDQIGNWYKVRLINGEQGWLKTDALEKI